MTVIRLPRSRKACYCGCRSTDLDQAAARVTGVAAYLTQRQAALRDIPSVPSPPRRGREQTPSPRVGEAPGEAHN